MKYNSAFSLGILASLLSLSLASCTFTPSTFVAGADASVVCSSHVGPAPANYRSVVVDGRTVYYPNNMHPANPANPANPQARPAFLGHMQANNPNFRGNVICVSR